MYIIYTCIYIYICLFISKIYIYLFVYSFIIILWHMDYNDQRRAHGRGPADVITFEPPKPIKTPNKLPSTIKHERNKPYKEMYSNKPPNANATNFTKRTASRLAIAFERNKRETRPANHLAITLVRQN